MIMFSKTIQLISFLLSLNRSILPAHAPQYEHLKFKYNTIINSDY